MLNEAKRQQCFIEYLERLNANEATNYYLWKAT